MDYALPIGAGVVSAFLTVGGVVCLLFMGHFLDCGKIGAAWGLWAGAAVINVLAWFCAPYQIMVVYTFLVLLSFVLLIALSFARGKKKGRHGHGDESSSCCGCDGGSSCCGCDGGSSCCSDGNENHRHRGGSGSRHHNGSGSGYSDNGDRPGLRYEAGTPSSSSSSSSYSSYSSKSNH
ncbi:MAG: hypothetical protein WC763_06280 [Candidatus Paceibacterota bacterium]|jgi:hypothetical protein